MRKMLIAVLTVALGWSLTLASVSTTHFHSGNPFIPAETDSGGPDAFGYTWKNNTEPGGPTLNWIDITTIGTQVTGLGDDNYVGPYQIGFPFHFYWYDVNQFYIGSNGYLKFGSGALIASPFPASIPLPASPNDFLAIYMADWIVGGTTPGTCYYWTNSVDSCVVSYLTVPAWDPNPPGYTGAHTFQVILTRADSSITFQYSDQQGTTYNNDILVGIESITGQVGLEHSHDTYMSRNSAIKFYYPDVVTYQVHDLAVQQAANPTSEGFFLEPGMTFTPMVIVKNTGNQTETSYTARFCIQQASGPFVYDQTATGGPIAPGEEQTITYSQTWTPTLTAQYVMYDSVALTGDMNPGNDKKRVECRTLTLPGTLLFDDGVPDQGLQWQGGGSGNEGGATRFVPPSYPVRIDSIRFFASTASQPFRAQIRDDNGPGGIAGDTLFSQDVTVGSSGWYALNVTPQNIQINDGAFYVVWLMTGSTSALGEDTTLIASRQAWEYTGVWSPYRSGETVDFLIRAKVSVVGPPNEPPEIISWYPENLETVQLGEAVEFGVTAIDPNQDPLTYLWKLDNVVQGTDSVVTIVFDSLGYHEVWVWVSDGELADSMNWALYVPVIGDSPRQLTPGEYALHPAHPDPFNPVTTISFDLPKSGDVRLAVYDQTGREIAKLVTGWRPAGTHQVVFDATGLASGIYIVKLNTGNFVASQKIVMMK